MVVKSPPLSLRRLIDPQQIRGLNTVHWVGWLETADIQLDARSRTLYHEIRRVPAILSLGRNVGKTAAG